MSDETRIGPEGLRGTNNGPVVPEDAGEVTDRVLTIPNLITFARLALLPVFAWLFLSARDAPALAVGFVLGSTDWVDGFVARRTGQVSKLGKVIDPIADRLAIITIVLLLMFRGTVPWPLAAAILLRDLVVSTIFIVLEARGFPRIPVNLLGKAATMAIYLGFGFAVASLVAGTALEAVMSMISNGLLAGGAALYWAAFGLYLVEIRRWRRLGSGIEAGARGGSSS